MYDPNVLRQLIQAAKRRREERREQEVKDFQSQVESLFSPELREQLVLTYMRDEETDTPVAVFAVHFNKGLMTTKTQWPLWHDDEGWKVRMVDAPNGTHDVVFTDEDDFLLTLDGTLV